MNNLKNKVQLIGHIGKEPEIFKFENGNLKASFSLATNSIYYNKAGDKVEDTQWHNVVTYGKTAELVDNYLNKGKEIAVEGKLNNRSYEDKDGNKKFITEIIVNELLMLGKKGTVAA